MRAWLRPRDRLIACEFEPRTAAALGKNLTTSTRAKVLAIDGWTALSAYLPPKERRGLVLIDPPYEPPDEFARLAEAFKQAQRKWASGIYLLWYPIKDRSGPDVLAKRLKALRIGKILRAEMTIARVPAAEFRCGSFLKARLPSCVAVTSMGECFNYLFDRANGPEALARLFLRPEPPCY